MGSRVTYSQDDILRSKIVAPGWYPVLVKSYSLEQAGTDGSDLHVFSITIDAPGNPFNLVPIRYQISEKASGMGIEFMEACGNEIKAGVTLEYDKQVGKKIDGFVQRGEYKGRPNNGLVAFRKRSGS